MVESHCERQPGVKLNSVRRCLCEDEQAEPAPVMVLGKKAEWTCPAKDSESRRAASARKVVPAGDFERDYLTVSLDVMETDNNSIGNFIVLVLERRLAQRSQTTSCAKRTRGCHSQRIDSHTRVD